MTHASDPLNIITTRSEHVRGAPSALHSNTSVLPPVLHYGDCPETRREHATRGFRGKSFTYPQKRKRALVRARAPDSDARCLLESLSSLPLVHRRAPPRASALGVWLLTRGVSRVLHHRFRKARADQPTLASVCLQCSHRVVKTRSGRSRTNTHAALQLTAAAPLQWEHSSSSKGG